MNSDKPLCILIPYKERIESVASCLDALLCNLSSDAVIVLVDDNSASDQSLLKRFRSDQRIVFLRHEQQRGAASTKNTGIRWCRSHGVSIVILLDSDCFAGPDFVEKHIMLHNTYPDVVCIGGSIRGEGRGLWAKLDGIASWFTSIPNSPERKVGRLYHIPTTNMSLKLRSISIGDNLFDERLITGEDVEFLGRLRRTNENILFSPVPCVAHADRTDLRGFLRHHFLWGVHTYAVRFGIREGALLQRILLASLLVVTLPLFALSGSLITLYPWLRQSPGYLLYFPPMFALWFVKTVGVIIGTCNPARAMHFIRTESHLDSKMKC